MSDGRIITFRDLEVWQESMTLAVSCYQLTASFPKPELYGGLASQARRAATSIPANVAEGKVRPTNAFRNHVSIALGSQAELDTVLEVAVRLGYLSAREMQPTVERLNRVGRMLNGLLAAIERRTANRGAVHR